MNEFFRKFATRIALWTGSAWAFIVAVLIVILWAVSKPMYKDSDTWLLIINTITTIITFLMVFVIQYSQNREIKALNIKISELVITNRKVGNDIAAVEELTDKEMDKIQDQIKDVVKS